LTGRAVSNEEPEETIELTINDTALEYEVEYETPAPYADEIIGKGKKQITIKSLPFCTNITAYTFIEETPKEKINSSKPLSYIDNNNDSLIDEVQWISNTGEQISIEIIKKKTMQ